MRNFIAINVLIAGLFVPALALACKCRPPPPPKEALEDSSAVFTAKVTKLTDVGDHERAVTLEIATTFKGVEKLKEVVVYTARDGAACGYGFEKGKSYLVYARDVKREEEMVLGTSLCSRTKSLADAGDDLKELGAGATP